MAGHHPRPHMHSVAALSSHPASQPRPPSVTASSQRLTSGRGRPSSWPGVLVLPSSHGRSWPPPIVSRQVVIGHHPRPQCHGLLPRPPPSVSRQVVVGHHHGQGFSSSHRLTGGRGLLPSSHGPSSSSSKRHGLLPASRQVVTGGTISLSAKQPYCMSK